MYQKELSLLIRLAYFAALTLIAWLIIRYLLLWLLPFLIAWGIAYAAEPVIQLLRRKLHLQRSFVAAVLTCLFLAALLTIASLLLTTMFRQAMELLTELPQQLSALPLWADRLQQRLDRFCAACPDQLRIWLQNFFDESAQHLATWFQQLSMEGLRLFTSAVGNLPQIILFVATTVLALFFTTGTLPGMMAFFRRQLAPTTLCRVRAIKKNLLTTLGKWLKAECILLAITFLQLLLGLLLLRQPYALLLAALITLVDMLPVFGIGTVLLPWAALCLLTEQIPQAIYLLLLYGIISLIRSILEPRIMAAQANLPPLAALAAMYVGFCLLGVAGMLLAPILLLFIKQLHDAGHLRLWK